MQEETLRVPVHAYPASGKVILPPALSFPSAPLGSTRSHAIELAPSSSVPLAFKLYITPQATGFTVEPATGTVGPDAPLTATVSFTPTLVATSSATLTLRTEQFDAPPVTCHLSGRGVPGATRDAGIAAVWGGAADASVEMAAADGAHVVAAAQRRAALARTVRGAAAAAEGTARLRKRSTLEPLPVRSFLFVLHLAAPCACEHVVASRG